MLFIEIPSLSDNRVHDKSPDAHVLRAGVEGVAEAVVD
jgi:hypothetical protein